MFLLPEIYEDAKYQNDGAEDPKATIAVDICTPKCGPGHEHKAQKWPERTLKGTGDVVSDQPEDEEHKPWRNRQNRQNKKPHKSPPHKRSESVVTHKKYICQSNDIIAKIFFPQRQPSTHPTVAAAWQ